MIKLTSRLELWLPTQPEYRMGYQKVIATLNSGGKEHGIIVNSEVFLKEGEYPWQMRMNDWSYVLSEAQKSTFTVTDVTLIPRDPESLRGVRQFTLAHEKFRVLSNRKNAAANAEVGIHASALRLESVRLTIMAANSAAEDAPITLTEAAEIFKRFSAYANDHRVTAGRGLTAGTFATTKEDADANIKTGSDAVARYALPNSKPASNVFTISPASDTELKRGTAQPANNQPGGGAEVIFVNGLPDGTVTGPITIPDK